MTKRLAYVNSFADRYGVRRYFFRRFGKRAPLPGKPGQPEFERAYAKALDASTRGIVKKDRVGPRSMAALIRSYRSDPDFIGCGPSTQRAYNQALKEIEEGPVMLRDGRGRPEDWRRRRPLKTRPETRTGHPPDDRRARPCESCHRVEEGPAPCSPAAL